MTSVQIAHEMRQAVETGTLAPGDRLPSIRQLQHSHGVAAATAARALQILIQEGLATAQQGRGTVVRDSHRWQWPMSSWERNHENDADAWDSNIRAQDGTPDQQVRVSIEPASREVAAALDIAEGAHVVTRSRVRTVNGEPHQLADSWFPQWLTDQHPEFLAPGNQSAPGGLLAAAGYPQARFKDEITARMPSRDESAALRMPPGTPLLIHTRVGYAADSRPVRVMVSRMTADRVEMIYELDA